MLHDRECQIKEFLVSYGLHDANRQPVSGDASFRRYERIVHDGKSFILMDAPPEREDVKPFISVQEFLVAHGYSAPDILAADAHNGFLLLEDLGDDLYSHILKQYPEREEELYLAAVDVLLDLHSRAASHNLPRYDIDVYMREAMLFAEWYIPQLTQFLNNQVLLHDAVAAFQNTMHDLLTNANLEQNVTVLRDYHADNLIWLPERQRLRRVGLLDFQDALMGSCHYDLVSLLEDARRDVSKSVAAKCLEYYLSAGNQSKDEFLLKYHLLAAQRNLKIIGIFNRLSQRDNKPRYLSYLPRVWGHLKTDISHPYLKSLRDFLDNYGLIES